MSAAAQNSLSALPWIAEHHFDTYREDHLNIIFVVTNTQPAYSPKVHNYGSQEPSQPFSEFVSCNRNVRNPTLQEIFDPLKARRIYPMFGYTDGEESLKTMLTEAGYNSADHVMPVYDYNVYTFDEAFRQFLMNLECEPSPTDEPSEGTVPTDAPTTTTTAPTDEPGEKCSDREMRVWLHLDLTKGFESWRAQSKDMLVDALSNLSQLYPNLKFGVSGFGDRSDYIGPHGPTDKCYREGITFADALEDEQSSIAVKKLMSQSLPQSNDFEEAPLDALPWIAKNQFGDYVDGELRLMIIVSDAGPHYSPKYENIRDDEPEQSLEDFINCDDFKRFGTLNEYMEPLKTRGILPIVTVHPREQTSLTYWEKILGEVGYDPSESLLNMGTRYDFNAFVETLNSIIGRHQCRPAPTVALSNGTAPTDKPTTTKTAKIVTTTTQKVTTAATTTGATEQNTTTQPKRTPNPVVLGTAAAGAGALAAAGLIHRFSKSADDVPDFDVTEEAPTDVRDLERSARETAVKFDEDAYGR